MASGQSEGNSTQTTFQNGFIFSIPFMTCFLVWFGFKTLCAEAINYSCLTWYIGFVITFVTRVPRAMAAEKEQTVSSRQGCFENCLLFLKWSTMGLLPPMYFLGWAPILAFADYDRFVTVPKNLWCIGATFNILHVLLYARSHADLGKNWSPSLEVRREHKLVTSGVYKYIRHPMYTSIGCGYIAQAMLVENFVAGFGGLFVFAMLCLIRIPIEEKMMRETFGAAYEVYVARSARLIPFIL